jgi:hypothetical protein
MDGPVTFFLNLYSSGRTLQAKFKWYDPSGKLVSQQDRTLHGPASNASRFWLTQVLPSVHVQAAGRGAMDLYLDDDHLGRYEFHRDAGKLMPMPSGGQRMPASRSLAYCSLESA